MNHFYDEGIWFSTPPLLPIAPLLDAFHQAGYGGYATMSRATGVSTDTLWKAGRRGVVNAYIADHLITRHLNTHPHAVYGDTWLDPDHYRAGRIDSIFEELTGIGADR